MNEQEIRAKSLEIAVQILGDQRITNQYDQGRYDKDAHVFLNQYRSLASEIENYIQGETPR